MTRRAARRSRARKTVLLSAALLLTLALPGCGTLFGVPLAGTWTGTYEPVEGDATGVLLLNLTVAGSSVTGTWESSLPGQLAQDTVSGVVESLVMLELTATTLPDCRFQLLAEQRRDRLVGGYVSDCGAVPGGWVELTKA